MIDKEKREQRFRDKEAVRRRMRAQIDPENYEYRPEKKKRDYYDTDSEQRVAIYVRVSTDDIRQTTSYELQKRYYEDFVNNHANWTLVKIYADEGISGTSMAHRDGLHEMLTDARAGKIDLIITKSVSRIARNVTLCIGIVRELAELKPQVGVFFESECIFSLNDDSQMALSFLSTMAEEESHTRSRSMETSLRMRLDNGVPLTPKLLGYTHDADGQLTVNEAEAPTVKLAFYMYLYGYSTQQIADTFIALGRRSYLGNIKWTAGSIVQILRNERHCGDVLTRKTFTENYRSHRTLKNRGERPQSLYKKHHTGIVSRDDFIAVQNMLENSKYGNKSILPQIKVIDSGALKGFVTINPRWAGFKAYDYFMASRSVYPENIDYMFEDKEVEIKVEAGDFDMRGFEITRTEFFDNYQRPNITFGGRRIRLNTDCIRRFGKNNYIELLINPIEMKFAIRVAEETNRSGVYCSQLSEQKYLPKDIPSTAFEETIYTLFGWNTDLKYRIIGTVLEQNDEMVLIFNAKDSQALIKQFVMPTQEEDGDDISNLMPVTTTGKRIRAIPKEWLNTFGREFYLHEKSMEEIQNQSEIDWKLRVGGEIFKTGKELKVTPFEELKSYISSELAGLNMEDLKDE